MNWRNFLNVSSEKPQVFFVVGPTASGKTKLAIDLAREIGGEIVSADSRQLYKYMDIGTAKPTKYERALVKHHLIDFLEPDANYSVADYYSDALKCIEDIQNRGKIPVFCGGTGLYVNALTKPFALNIESSDENVRKELEETAAALGNDELYRRLEQLDPAAARNIHPNNLKRIIRALEIYEVTGKTKTELEKENRGREIPFEPVLLMPDYPRDVLYQRINQRVDQMMDEGLLDEVIELESKYPRNTNSLQAIGYKEFYPYLDGEIPLEEAVRILKRDTRHYAKRQLTWFNHDDRILPLRGELL